MLLQSQTNIADKKYHQSAGQQRRHSLAGAVSAIAPGIAVLRFYHLLTLEKVTYRYYIGMLSFLNEEYAKARRAGPFSSSLTPHTGGTRAHPRILSLPHRCAREPSVRLPHLAVFAAG
jgi:hypothetical protein